MSEYYLLAGSSVAGSSDFLLVPENVVSQNLLGR